MADGVGPQFLDQRKQAALDEQSTIFVQGSGAGEPTDRRPLLDSNERRFSSF